MTTKTMSVRNVVVVSDLHCGSRLGLCPPEGVPLDDGGTYKPSEAQRKVWQWWGEFWREWVPHVCRNEPYCVVVNGDALDGVHHGATETISNNLADQAVIAETVLEPIAERARGGLYVVRGTEAHVGKQGQEEERLAHTLGAVCNSESQSARWDLWLDIEGRHIHFLHHIGTTGSNAYEATAVNKELTEEYNEAARWREMPPDCIVRSHRHRNIQISVPTAGGYGIAFVTAGWQLKTPFVWRLPGGRLAPPQFGGSVVRLGDEDLYTRHMTWTVGRTRCEVPTCRNPNGAKRRERDD